MERLLAEYENLKARFATSAVFRRVVVLGLLVVVAWLDYLTGPQITFAPFYIIVLAGLAFFEPWPICLAYSGVAAVFLLLADVLSTPGTATLVYPYWRAFARLFSFTIICVTTSLLVGERSRMRLSEHSLRDKTQELEEKNQRLEEALRELRRLQDELVAKERKAAVADSISLTTYEIERPLVSVAIYVEELLRLSASFQTAKDPQHVLEDIQPVLEKLRERTGDLEAVLQSIRDLRKRQAGTGPAGPP